MFANANEIASKWTFPIVTSTKNVNNRIDCSCAAFVLLNDEGWILTAAHIFDSWKKYQNDQNESKEYFEKLDRLSKDTSISPKIRGKRIARLSKNDNWITRHSFWWGIDNVNIINVSAIRENDLLIGQLNPFDSTKIKEYPVIKNPQNLKHGTSLCKLGFPFHTIHATYDEITNRFSLAPDALPLPRFPIDGIYTRDAVGLMQDGKTKIKFLETSSPGLRGQSGGPIFDVNGVVWAIQSRTAHLPLGFSPKIKVNGKDVEENQFLNVGLGVHPEIIVDFLNDNGIKFNLSQ